MKEKIALSYLRFVQKHIFHDQVRQLHTTHPLPTLIFRRGWCGNAARTLAFFLELRGIRYRFVGLFNHVVLEAFWNDKWHVLDADLFKHGIVLRKDDGTIPSIVDLQNSYLVDRFPPTMYLYTREYKRYRDLPSQMLQAPRMFEPHEAGYMSYYFQISKTLPLEYPPTRPSGLHASPRTGGYVDLAWEPSDDKDNNLTGYKVLVSDRSRGWRYFDPDEHPNCAPRDTYSDGSLPWSDVNQGQGCIMFTEETSVEIMVPHGVWYWSVKAVDEHRKKEPRTYYFPSEESSFVA